MRVGLGYDVHRFGGTRPLRLGGVTIPFSRGLLGHSDADVLLHAVADALFGAIGAPDIGEQFPSGDSRWRHTDSGMFVQAAQRQARLKGWAIGNLDAVVVADRPKLVGFKRQIARSLGRLLDLDAERISIKAKTTETFCPGGKGIAAHAVVLLEPLRRGAPRGGIPIARPGERQASTTKRARS